MFQAIRHDERNHDKPIIVLSVVSEKEVARAFPIWDYLIKPIRPDDLLASLQRAGIKAEKNKRILVVDDDPKTRKLAAAALQQLDYKALCVADAESGLNAAAHEQFAAVVLDLLMPDTDGFEFLERFRQTSLGSRTPVIVWTNKDISARDRSRLRSSASLALKSQGGINAVLRELKQHLTSDP